MGLVIALLIVIIVGGAALFVWMGRKDPDGRPLGDTPEAHDELNPHDVPKWDRATRMAAEEQSGGTEGTTGGNAEGEAGGPAVGRGGTGEGVDGARRHRRGWLSGAEPLDSSHFLLTSHLFPGFRGGASMSRGAIHHECE